MSFVIRSRVKYNKIMIFCSTQQSRPFHAQVLKSFHLQGFSPPLTSSSALDPAGRQQERCTFGTPHLILTARRNQLGLNLANVKTIAVLNLVAFDVAVQ